MTPRPRLIPWALSETGNDGKSQGAVYSFAIDRKTGRLRQLGRADSGGGGARLDGDLLRCVLRNTSGRNLGTGILRRCETWFAGEED